MHNLISIRYWVGLVSVGLGLFLGMQNALAFADYDFGATTVLTEADLGSRVPRLYPQDRLIILLPSDRLFDLGSAEFLPGAPRLLDEVVKLLKQYPNYNIHVSAHLDAIGEKLERHSRFLLTFEQAQHVAGYLWAHNVHLGAIHRHLTYSGNEKLNPIATNKTLWGMTLNRRIQIVVYGSDFQSFEWANQFDVLGHRWDSWQDSNEIRA